MWQLKGKKSGYIIHKTNNRYLLCKILNEYNSESDATTILAELLTNKTTERKLLKEYSKKPI